MKKALLFVISLVIVAIVCAVYVQLRHAEQDAKVVREASKMQELQIRLEPELKTYYQEHGAYPQKLQDLALKNFEWGHEGATPKDLESFSYFSDGQTFVMRWRSVLKSGGGEHEFATYLAGKKGESIFSETETNKIQTSVTNGR